MMQQRHFRHYRHFRAAAWLLPFLLLLVSTMDGILCSRVQASDEIGPASIADNIDGDDADSGVYNAAATTTAAHQDASSNPGVTASSSITDLVNSPEWQPFYKRLVTTATLQDLLFSSSSSSLVQPDDNEAEQHAQMLNRLEQRRLQEIPARSSSSSSSSQGNGIPCNQVLDSISLVDLKTTLTDIVDALLSASGGEGSLGNAFLKSLLVDRLQTGLQVVQVCGSCVDSIPASQLAPHLDYCGPSIYGNNRTYSGLLFLPTVEGGEGEDTSAAMITHTTNATTHSIIRPGTHPGYIYLPGTRVSLTETPSLLWQGRQATEPVVWLFMAMASSQGIPWLSPYTMGYGNIEDDNVNDDENNDNRTSPSPSYKAYIIRKGYETAIVPLWYQTQTLMREWSGGCAALGDAAMIAGYSEGGYSSVVVAHALRKNAGVNVWKVQSGAGPYKVRSEALWGIWKLLQKNNNNNTTTASDGDDNGDIPYSTDNVLYSIVGLLGVSYSSTYPHLANYQASQDLLKADDEIRDILVDLLTGPEPVKTSYQLVEQIQELLLMGGSTSSDNLLGLLNPAFVDAAEQFYGQNENDTDICNTIPLETLQELKIDLLCAALAQNDLTTLLETEVDYPVEFCQSPHDEIVLESNLPDLAANPEFLTRVPGVAGDHITAGETCFLHVLQSAILSAPDLGKAYDTIIEPLHDENKCTGTSGMPPDTAPTTSSSFSTTTTVSTLLQLLLYMC